VTPLINPAIHPERLYNFTPVYNGVEPLSLDEFADSANMLCIKTSPSMLRFLLTAWELYRYDFVIQGNSTEREHTHLELLRLHEQLIMAEPCQPCPDCPPSGGGGGSAGGGVQLPDCIEVVQSGNEIVINIQECCDMAGTINVYEGCGCGCGESSSGGGGQTFGGGSSSGGGGAGGSWLVEPDQNMVAVPEGITQCDFVTTTMPLVMDSLTEFVRVIDDNAENLQEAVDAVIQYTDTFQQLAPFLGDIGAGTGELVSGVIGAGSAALLAMLSDNDFRYEVSEAWLRAHGTDGYITQITRQDFFDVTRYLPLTFLQPNAIVLPRLIFPLFWRILNINKINSRLIIAKNTGQDGLCQYLFAGAGLEYAPPITQDSVPDPAGFPTEAWLLSQGYAWAHVYDLRDAPFVDNTSFNWTLNAFDEQQGEWLDGEGYVASCDLRSDPHMNMSLRFDIVPSWTGGGQIQYAAVDYQYTPQSNYTSAQNHVVADTTFGHQDAFDGVREITGLTIGSGTVDNYLRPLRCPDPASVCCGTKPVIRRIALAGAGTDPLTGLVQ